MGNDADSHELLAVVATIHHERVSETLDDGTVGLAEALDGITASGVRDVDGGANLDIVSVEDLVSQSSSTPAAQLRIEKSRASKPTVSSRSCTCELRALGRVLTSMRYLELRHPRMTTC